MTTIDKQSIVNAYEEVRADNSDTTWFTLHFDGNSIKLERTGSDYDEFLLQFTDEERKFGYVRIVTGDEMSKRAKFALITWVGRGVSAIKKAKLSVDKSLVKNIIKTFSVEILAEEHTDISKEVVKELLIKAGGANYGTGQAS